MSGIAVKELGVHLGGRQVNLWGWLVQMVPEKPHC